MPDWSFPGFHLRGGVRLPMVHHFFEMEWYLIWHRLCVKLMVRALAFRGIYVSPLALSFTSMLYAYPWAISEVTPLNNPAFYADHIDLSWSTDIHMMLGSSCCSFPLRTVAANKCSCGDQQQQQMGAFYYTKPMLSQLPARWDSMNLIRILIVLL